ncbi:MAG: DUF4256 domain-containing protein [Ginsengibacter sp.]
MSVKTRKKLSTQETDELLSTLKSRFEKNSNRHKNIKWAAVEDKLRSNESKLWSLNEMEETGGEPDVVEITGKRGQIIYFDCSPESPKGRRSLCYDRAALNSRKEYKPANSALDMAEEMGVELLNEEQYRGLQQVGMFDQKTSSWVITPEKIRKLGGALFCDRKYDTVFVYHNGAESYYAARGFRACLSVR